MFHYFLKASPILILWIVFVYVVLQTPYPDTITQASIMQLIFFFIPLLLAITLTLNIFLKNIFISGSICLGLIFSLILMSLDSLNLVTGIITLIAVGLLISYFKKVKKKGLTNYLKIPKLTKLRRDI